MGCITLIIKPTRHCNLSCTYCHDRKEGPNQVMTFRVMAQMIISVLKDPTNDVINFIWHGGEPTLLPISFYEKALLVQSRFRRPGQVILNSIQTNGTLLTPEWVKFLHNNEFSVSISLDGPAEIHNQNRPYASGQPSFDDVIRGIQLLQEYGEPMCTLTVVDESTLKLGPDRLFDFFLNMGIKNIALLAATPTNQPEVIPFSATEHYVDPKRMTNFLIGIYDKWAEHGDLQISIRELDIIRKKLSNNEDNACTLAGNCLEQFYLIEPNGDVAHCDVFFGDPRYILGNLMNEDFANIRKGYKMQALIKAYQQEQMRMKRCPEFSICNGSCPHQRYLSLRHNPHHKEDCCGLHDLIVHIRNSIGIDHV